MGANGREFSETEFFLPRMDTDRHGWGGGNRIRRNQVIGICVYRCPSVVKISGSGGGRETVLRIEGGLYGGGDGGRGGCIEPERAEAAQGEGGKTERGGGT